MLITNEKLTKAFLGIEDHGILTASITMESSSGLQGFGGHRLDGPEMTNFAGNSIKRLLKVVGVDSWDQLAGNYVRVCRLKPFEAIQQIGHIAEDRWFRWQGQAIGEEEMMRAIGNGKA